MKPLANAALTPDQLAMIIEVAGRANPLVTEVRAVKHNYISVYDYAIAGLALAFNPLSLLLLIVVGG